VLILQSNVRGITPATLPTCGLFDQLAAQNLLNDTIFTNAGYGLQNRVVGGGVPYFQDVNPIPRMYSFSSFNALNNTFIRLSQNPATGNGGACYGDSGGPNFLTVNGQQILGSITITAMPSAAQQTLPIVWTRLQRKTSLNTSTQHTELQFRQLVKAISILSGEIKKGQKLFLPLFDFIDKEVTRLLHACGFCLRRGLVR
jgi:hypothetical protein